MSLSKIHVPQKRDHGTAFMYPTSIRDLDGISNPVLNVDFFTMPYPTFPPHPHAGFSAVTYMLQESEGSFQNRDSLGDVSTIAPGTLHWTFAGSGILHEEIPTVPGVPCHGLQIFFNTSSKFKTTTPIILHKTLEEQEILQENGKQIRNVLSLPNEIPNKPIITRIDFTEKSEHQHKFGKGRGGMVLNVLGISYLVDLQLAVLEKHSSFGFFGEEESNSFIISGEKGSAIVIIEGDSIPEPIVFGGPFVMNSQKEIIDAMDRYHRGEMGSLSPSF